MKPRFYNNRDTMRRFEQLAETFYRVAAVNHYMVGVAESFNDDELQEAESLLQFFNIAKSTATTRRALDLVEAEKRRRRLG